MSKNPKPKQTIIVNSKSHKIHKQIEHSGGDIQRQHISVNPQPKFRVFSYTKPTKALPKNPRKPSK